MRSDAARNREQLLRAATVAFHRDGLTVAMASIAAEAGVGAGTLYRHFADRDALLAELTHRSFEQVLANAQAAERAEGTPIERLRHFVRAAMKARKELVLPLHGGPELSSSATRRLRTEVHRTIQRILDLGIEDGSIRADARALDVVVFGAMLSQPTQATPEWNAVCNRLLDNFLAGLRP